MMRGFVTNYYTWTPIESSGMCDAYLVTANFKPRKAEFGSMLAKAGMDAQEPEKSVDQILAEKKEEFREKLHYGRGGMSLQEWDDFLADLVDWGIITNSTRNHANGTLMEIPEGAQNGGVGFRTRRSELTLEEEFDQLWTGDPLKWLDKVDVYMLQNSLYANMNCVASTGISNQRDSYRNVAQILREILW